MSELDEAIGLLHEMLKAVNAYADEESIDIIYGELRQKVELYLSGRLYESRPQRHL